MVQNLVLVVDPELKFCGTCWFLEGGAGFAFGKSNTVVYRPFRLIDGSPDCNLGWILPWGPVATRPSSR